MSMPWPQVLAPYAAADAANTIELAAAQRVEVDEQPEPLIAHGAGPARRRRYR